MPGEHLDRALTTFASLTNGELCGNISAASLATAPAPLQSGGASACDEGYGASNHMLDILVRGCTTLGIITIIAPTQPDKVDASMPAAGAGGAVPARHQQRKSEQLQGQERLDGHAVDLPRRLRLVERDDVQRRPGRPQVAPHRSDDRRSS